MVPQNQNVISVNLLSSTCLGDSVNAFTRARCSSTWTIPAGLINGISNTERRRNEPLVISFRLEDEHHPDVSKTPSPEEQTTPIKHSSTFSLDALLK